MHDSITPALATKTKQLAFYDSSSIKHSPAALNLSSSSVVGCQVVHSSQQAFQFLLILCKPCSLLLVEVLRSYLRGTLEMLVVSWQRACRINPHHLFLTRTCPHALKSLLLEISLSKIRKISRRHELLQIMHSYSPTFLGIRSTESTQTFSCTCTSLYFCSTFCSSTQFVILRMSRSKEGAELDI